MPNTALITGVTGQDGSYLAELLLSHGYEVHGLVRRVASEHPEHRLWRIRHLQDRLTLHAGSLESPVSLHRVVAASHPNECYHLAAQSYVGYSFEDVGSTLQTNIDGTHHLLTALHTLAPQCRVYFAGSSEQFGQVIDSPQHERSPFIPQSPYGISKVAGYALTRYFREVHGLHASSGLLFNHESPRRGTEFVTRKITSAVARIANGSPETLKLGNLTALRDWGHARDYVRAMWLMLQQDTPDDYVIATGEQHSVEEFVETAFAQVDLDWRRHVVQDSALYRPAEVQTLLGDASKAKRMLGWEPETRFAELVAEMVTADCDRITVQGVRDGTS